MMNVGMNLGRTKELECHWNADEKDRKMLRVSR
jgi:hypothetical protein